MPQEQAKATGKCSFFGEFIAKELSRLEEKIDKVASSVKKSDK